MFDVLQEVNLVAVGVATVAYFVLGALWFTPLFGKAYDAGTGVKRSANQKWPAMYYIGPFLSSLAVTAATAVLLYALSVQSMVDALVLGFVVGIGYLASTSLSNAIAPNMPRPLVYGLVVGCYHLVGVMLVSAILFLMKG
ncbi:MAG TPA: DUF1761 domain-containing protein [Candidatus Saccharimonadales bacterium]|nr:DUF1761 domain-containing protein [Candidatus Saccharimonadales bacterium]